MGCFFDCFRIRDEDRTNREAVVSSNNTLSSLFTSSSLQDTLNESENDKHTVIQISDGLRQEAKFLKACGTIPETPIEIRKASQKLKSSPPCDKHSDPSKFHSWLSDSSIKKLELDEQSDQSPTKAELPVGACFLEQTPSSYKSCTHNPGGFSINLTEGNEERSSITHAKDPAEGKFTEGRTKSVRFDCDFDASSKSSSGSSSQISNKYESPGIQSVRRPSPNPTPLKLSDEMQTPGTEYASALGTLTNGKTQIRSQYVYSVLNPIDKMSHWNVIKEENSVSSSMPDEVSGADNQLETSAGKDSKLEASLSSWLKKPPSVHDNNQDLDRANKKDLIATPGDRPIIGMVAAHWNADESSNNISPKWWDGNGIPNSTNKYKEDQKVCWHATPFEERLEKALSEESLVSQRKQVSGNPIIFEDSEESDTALSQLHSSMHSKSVVSC
ncbi:hypothetical protein ACFE04_000364 [Oxalis oulophora]